jgi:hypothetical protein
VLDSRDHSFGQRTKEAQRQILSRVFQSSTDEVRKEIFLMAQFRVSINFSTTVSEQAADELEYLVDEFVQGILNVVANDEHDQVAAGIANTIPELNPGAVVPINSFLNPIFSPDEGSDAPVYDEADWAQDNGATDFDRR